MRLGLHLSLAVGLLMSGPALAATEIDLFFPVPVQGKLAIEMQRMIGDFNDTHTDVHVTPVYTGSYDDTNLKTHAAIKAGKPPAAVIMSANFVREYVINDEIVQLGTSNNPHVDAVMIRFLLFALPTHRT